MAKLILSVTKVATSKTDKGTLTSCRLMIDGRSMWLNTDSLPGCKLISKDTGLETDDTLFNADKFEVKACANENGTFYKLVPKTAFKLAAF